MKPRQCLYIVASRAAAGEMAVGEAGGADRTSAKAIGAMEGASERPAETGQLPGIPAEC